MTDVIETAPVDLVDFETMEHRIRYVAEVFKPYVSGRVLDVGCAQRYL